MRRFFTLFIACFIYIICFSQNTVTTKFKCYFIKPYEDMRELSEALLNDAKQGTIPKGKVLEVIGYDHLNFMFYKVKYKKKEGFVHRDVVTDRSFLIKKDTKIREEYRDCVLEKSIALGMNRYELETSIGKPLDINRTVNANGIKEQYIYGNVNTKYYVIGYSLHSTSITTNRFFVYLDDGVVTSYQD